MNLTLTTLIVSKDQIYDTLSSKEKESYNTAKLISEMAEYGYLEHMRVNGDKHGADIIFYRSSDCSVLKVQLKGRLTFKKSYIGKELCVAFPIRQNNKTSWYLYDHDELLNVVLEQSNIASTSSWLENGSYSWPKIPQFVLENLTILETT